MKKLFQPAILGLVLTGIALVSCKKVDLISKIENTEKLQPRYSTMAEFKQGISQAINLIGQYNVPAYLDTLPNGYPNYQNGRKVPLVNFGSAILEKLYGNQEQVASSRWPVDPPMIPTCLRGLNVKEISHGC